MRTFITAALILLATGAFAQEQEVKQRFIEVVGSSKIEVAPDIAYFTIVINEVPKENISIGKQEQDMVKILRKYNVPAENLTIDNTSGLRQKVNFWGSKDVVSSKTFTLKLTDLSTTDRILDEISSLKIASITLVKVENSAIETHKLNACELAAKNAIAKATAFTKGMGVTLLAPLTIYEQNLFVSGDEEDYRPRYLMNKAMSMDASGADDSSQQGFKNITVKCTVRTRVEIK